jgi:hypothetical protein
MTNKLNIIILILFVIIISDCSTVLIDHGKIGYLEPNKNDIDSKLIIANKCFSIFDTIIIEDTLRELIGKEKMLNIMIISKLDLFSFTDCYTVYGDKNVQK